MKTAALKITVFCNSTVAFPAIEYLLAKNVVSGLAVPLAVSEGAFQVYGMATRLGIPFLMADPANFSQMERWLVDGKPDAVFVLTFPYRIPESALSLPRFGFFNFHPGLLPAYRGPDPLFWEIRNQEPYGGVTVHRMEARFDTGPVVYTEAVAISRDTTYDQHLDSLQEPYRKAVAWMLDHLSGSPDPLPEVPQEEAAAAYQHKPGVEDLTIHWDSETADSIAALTRACHTGYGGARTFFRNMLVLFNEVTLCEEHSARTVEPGTILCVSENDGIRVSCRAGASLRVMSCIAGTAVLTGGQFALAHQVRPGERFRSSAGASD